MWYASASSPVQRPPGEEFPTLPELLPPELLVSVLVALHASASRATATHAPIPPSKSRSIMLTLPNNGAHRRSDENTSHTQTRGPSFELATPIRVYCTFIRFARCDGLA